ncbi:MAG: methyltransferase domain-containing protein [Deltaproteobacteria bacterium]|nr:methyltransferase domain-containing protein [Deltaproteobacteria bacterium]
MAQQFDQYTTTYEEELAKSLSASGESRDYFAAGRVAWLAKCLDKLEVKANHVLDFGCGDGLTTPMLLSGLGATSAVGTDVSEGTIAEALKRHAVDGVSYAPLSTYKPAGNIDVAYCNGVFHHIAPAERDEAVSIVRDSLRPGGLFALWENNPWNPATRYVMSRCAFDEDAITLTPPEARRLVVKNGFEIVRTDYRFIFPRALRFMRWFENLVYFTPLGTQYMVLAQKI